MPPLATTTPQGPATPAPTSLPQTPRRAAAPTVAPAANAAMEGRRFLALLAQLALLLGVFWGFQLEDKTFLLFGTCVTIAFAIHYVLPFQWKKWGFFVLSVLGGLVVLAHAEYWNVPWYYVYAMCASTIAFAVAIGLLFYWLFRLTIPFYQRVLLVLAVTGLLAWARAVGDIWIEMHWPIIGGIFMFRMILYAYEVRVGKTPERISDFLTYFFSLPSFYYPLFPVIDYDTFKKGHYRENIHDTAQRGIGWMARGAMHLCLYRLINQELVIGPAEVHSPLTLAQYIFPVYLLYLQVSGRFHLIVGMLHLFGYALPETNRNWLLANSFTDFWRRINIYWKDFMVKVFYYPVYFRLRRKNESLALALATVTVFAATWALHGYQFFWLKGSWYVTAQDAVFWSILGTLVLLTLLWQQRRGRPVRRSKPIDLVLHGAQVLAVYLTISVLWSMWSSASLEEWWDAVTYWRVP